MKKREERIDGIIATYYNYCFLILFQYLTLFERPGFHSKKKIEELKQNKKTNELELLKKIADLLNREIISDGGFFFQYLDSVASNMQKERSHNRWDLYAAVEKFFIDWFDLFL